MRGVIFPGDNKIDYIEVPDPVPGPGEVVIEVKASGLCGSDLNLYRAKPGAPKHPKLPVDMEPMIAGHEPSGVVAEIGPGVDPALATVGDRVMVHHYWGCTRCDHCRSGWPQMCDNQMPVIYGMSGHGGHAPYLKVPAQTLVPLPDELSFLAGAGISCGVGTAFGALMRVNPSGKDTVAIVGQGPVGLGATQLAKALGSRVIALDVNTERLELARKLGADEVVNPAETDSVEALLELTAGRGVDFAIETSGAPIARTAAIRSLRPWGSIVLVAGGTPLEVENVSLITSRQLSIVGSWTFSVVGQAECARFVVERGVDLDALFTQTWSIDEAEAAYRQFAQQADGKAAFVW